MVDQNCAYCMEGELVAKFGIKICELETSKVYLFKEQSHPGRCIVAHKKHVGDMNELTAEERAAYFEDVARVARAIMKAFNPDKVNYGAYGDTGHCALRHCGDFFVVQRKAFEHGRGDFPPRRLHVEGVRRLDFVGARKHGVGDFFYRGVLRFGGVRRKFKRRRAGALCNFENFAHCICDIFLMYSQRLSISSSPFSSSL